MTISFLIGYFCGSIPFGLLLTRIFGLGDIRQIGSGNIGATNVLRTGNRKIAAVTLLLDALKGAAPILFFTGNPALAAGLGAVLGHMFPVWLKFKGGKGVATTLGVLLGLSWQLGLVVCALWLSMALLFKISSLAALVSIGLAPLLSTLFVTDYNNAPYVLTGVALLVWSRHHENIRRLLKGEEPKIGSKK